MASAARCTLFQVVLDEIALEGLEGITLPSLWVYVSKAKELPLPLANDLQEHIWQFILRFDKDLEFFELPVKRQTVQVFDRFALCDSDFGVPISPEQCPLPRYKIVPIQNGAVIGSCEFYLERIPIRIEQLHDLSVTDVLKTWGTKFVIVASQELRYNALTPINCMRPELSAIHYSVWEAIGRARQNGETTAGTWSLINLCKESTFVFYIKHKLVRSGLVQSQPFNEKHKTRLIISSLLTLPRFYSTQRSMLTHIIQKLYEALKEAPNYRMTLIKARHLFPSIERQKAFKKITITHVFRRLFDAQAVPYSKLHGKTRRKQNLQLKERTVTVVSLRNPNLTIEDLFVEESTEQRSMHSGEFLDYNHTFVDMPFTEELYRAVKRHGPKGCSQTDLCNYMGLHGSTIRYVVRVFEDNGLIKSYCTDVGRQKLTMYVANVHSANIDEKKHLSLDMLKNMKCGEEPNLPDYSDITLTDISAISANIKVFEYIKSTSTRDSPSTQRTVARKALIVKSVDEKCLVQVHALRLQIQYREKEEGYRDEVCQKSVRRLLYSLCMDKIVRMYEIVLKYDEHIRLYRYVTHPKIEIDSYVLKQEMLKLKNSLFLIIEERRLRNEAADKDQEKRSRLAKKSCKGPEKKAKDNSSAQPHKPPKFLISRYMHEFLFYIVVELNEYERPIEITEELLQQWQETEPALQVNECLDYLKQDGSKIVAYSKEISWRTFINPLPKYADKPARWVYFMDAVDRMPLSMFNKIFRIERGADERLQSYLVHPVRQHYLMRQLPVDLQCHISRTQLQKVYTTMLKLLNHMGLVQVGERQNMKDPLILWVFLNRYASIVETTSTEASYMKINTDRDYDRLSYEFNSFDDLHQYWTNLHRICVYTKLGFGRGKHEKLRRRKEPSFIGSVDFDDAPLHDTGKTPGDGLGAAGLSTHLLSHTFRNWSWVLHTSNKTKPVRSGRITQTSKHTKITQHRKNPSITRLQLGAAIRRVVTKSSASHDAIDRDALKHMRTLRVSWAKKEDNWLKMTRAVYLYVAAPVPALGLLTVGKICRDIMRQNINSYNKTSQACVRRVNFIIKTHRHVPEVPTWVHMLQTNEYMNRKYGDNFLQKLKETYPNRSEFCSSLAIHFILIMNYLFKMIDNTSGSSNSRFIIPDTVAEFNKKFTHRPFVIAEHVIEYQNPKTEFELQVAVASCVLHSSLCCARDKTLYNLQAFEIYKGFSEEVLHTAFSKARSDTLIVAIKRKNLQSMQTQLSGPAYLLSSRYRLRLMFLKIPYNVYDAFYGYFETAVSTLFGPSTSQAKKQLLELKSPHLGHLVFIAEGLAQSYLESFFKLPINILTVDAEQRQAVSSMDRILDHYQCILDNAPHTEYTKGFENEPYEKQVRVGFHPANLSYRLHYTPYDIISKLPTRYLHFFCALDHLQKEVDINFSKLLRKDDEHGCVIMECPFNCIMKNANYINAIERIVRENRAVLTELSEMPPQKLLNLATSGCLVTVQPANLLTLVRMLESFWREKEIPSDRKDLGKVAPNVKSNKSIDWQKLCNEILDFDANDEDNNDKNDDFEPTLNKEERIARAQDVFVVNLPTLQFGVNSKLSVNTDTVRHAGIEVPKVMLDTEVNREAILQKITSESYWKYTENTFEGIKPQLSDLNFNDMELKHLEDIHNFIESHKLGVTGEELLCQFPYEEFLLRALRTLASHCLIKRMGVATFVYVHKSHMRAWVVHTFHIKRLEREALGGGDEALAMSLKKRTHDEVESVDDSEADEANVSKKAKLVESSNNEEPLPKRQKTQTQRLICSTGLKPTVLSSSKRRDVIVMKPQPWMRLNGSLNRRVLDRWLGSILTECISRAGCSVQEICLRFPHMLPVDIMFLLEILCDLKCIHLTQIAALEVDLFSVYENVKESMATELYNPEVTYINTHSDAIMRMAIFIGNKKYTAEFI